MDKRTIEKIFEQYRSHKSDTEIFHDLMHYKVREILLVATLYDSFIMQQEEQLTEKIFGEYYQLSLSNAPRITSVSSANKALELMKKYKYDLVIITMRIADMSPFKLAKVIKDKRPKKPVILLLNDNTEIPLLKGKEKDLEHFDRTFVWNGDARVFLAITKYAEDKRNVGRDTRIGLVRVILLVEDSIRYYSKYLPVLYTEVIKQTQSLIKEEHLDETQKILRMRARPKILLATTYEEAIHKINKYKDNLLCVISDVKFPRKGKPDKEAGIKLIKYVKSKIKDLPTLLQSSDESNREKAYKIESSFIYKHSENLVYELQNFVFNYLGFGPFVFRDKDGKIIDKANNMQEFADKIKIVPEESLLYHAKRNHFSAWLMARGEIRIAKRLQELKISDFSNVEEMRKYLIKVCEEVHHKSTRGKVINFDEGEITTERHILKLQDGSLGGKGRGIAFMNALIENTKLYKYFPDINLKIPKTSIIGTEEFENFIKRNRLEDVIETNDYNEIKDRFVNGELSEDLDRRLRKLLEHLKRPLAVRSSGLFEDSLAQPFSGIYATYLIPNNHPDIEVRLKQLKEAIKLVFASVFSPKTKDYFNAINYKIEEERMAVIIQEVVGNAYENRYYPHFSGVAQSYNYYPISYIKPEDGIGVVGVGLGKFVIDGENTHRFCPRYPKIDFIPPEEQLDNTQRYFYAVDLTQKEDLNLKEKGEDATLLKLEIDIAEKDGVLDYIASTWDYNSSRLLPGIRDKGPRIINFAHILKYDYFPLAKTLSDLLDIVEKGMGTPVEMEFAVDLNKGLNNKPTFYILQIKPVIKHREFFTIKEDEIKKDQLILFTKRGMGNGVIDNIKHIVYIPPERFDKMETEEMAKEIDEINREMKNKNNPYILIGPGRWGTRDKFLGIPIMWTQISNAKVIVEVELPDFRVEPSLGSHFFHNIISMNVGYFSVDTNSQKEFIDWEYLKKYTNQTHKYFSIVELEKPSTVKMDGKNRIYIIEK